MSTVGTHIRLSLIDDGTQIVATLISTQPLNQAYLGDITLPSPSGAAYPDWTIPSNQPIVYVDVSNGDSDVNTVRNPKWFYNGEQLEFDSQTGISTGNHAGKFMSTTYQPIPEGRIYTALKIITNLAQYDNVDEDTLAFSAEAAIGSAYIPFKCSIDIAITSLTKNDYYTTIKSVKSDFPAFLTNGNGFVFDEFEEHIVLINELVQFTPEQAGPQGDQPVGRIGHNAYNPRWYINSVEVLDEYHGNQGETISGYPAKKCIVWLGSNGKVQFIGDAAPAGYIGYRGLIIDEKVVQQYANIGVDCYITSQGVPRKVATDYQTIEDHRDRYVTYTAAMVSQSAAIPVYTEPFDDQFVVSAGEGCDNTLRMGQQCNYKVFVADKINRQLLDTRYEYWALLINKADTHRYGEEVDERRVDGQAEGAKALQDTSLIMEHLDQEEGEDERYLHSMTRDRKPGEQSASPQFGRCFITAADLINMGRTMGGWIYGSDAPFGS